MLARIGLPGNSYHDWKRGLTPKEAEAWCAAALARRWPNGPYPADAKISILTEKETDRCRYRDGRRCYEDPSRP